MQSVFDLLKRRAFVQVPISLVVSADDWELIRKGSMPQSMEDKWVILYRRSFLYFCRSSGKGHAIFRTRPQREDNNFRFSTVWCRRNIEPYYTPSERVNEAAIVTRLIEQRLKTPKDAPWFGWDPRYPKDPKFLNPDFSDYTIR